MAIRFHELPLDAFDEKAQPYIKRLNLELRQLFDLEGVLRSSTQTKTSGSVSRNTDFQVNVTRVEPSITQIVSGQSTVVGAPALTFGLTNVKGSTNTAVSINSAIALFDTSVPPAIDAGAGIAGLSSKAANVGHKHQVLTGPPTNGFTASATGATGSATTLMRTDATLAAPYLLCSTPTRIPLEFTDDTATTGLLKGLSTNITMLHLDVLQLGLSVGSAVFNTPTLAANARLNVNVDPDFNNYGIQSAWLAGTFNGASYACWDARSTGPGSGVSDATFCGFDTSALSLNPTGAISGGLNYMYGIRCMPQIANNGASFTDAAAGYFRGVRRSFVSPNIAYQAGIIVEPPTAGTSAQFGILVRQQTAQATGSVRYGIYVDAQNSGTVRYSFYGVSDPGKFTGPLGVDGNLGVTGNATVNGAFSVGTNFSHTGNSSFLIKFYNATGTTQSDGWSISNITRNTTLNGSSFTLNDVMNVLGTILNHLQLRGDITS